MTAAITNQITNVGKNDGQLQTPGVPVIVRKIKTVLVSTAATADGSDIISVTLADKGLRNVLAVMGSVHTTDNSVIVVDSPVTKVTSGVFTATIPAGNDNKMRSYILIGEAN